jgi:hypothetical protein
MSFARTAQKIKAGFSVVTKKAAFVPNEKRV